MTPDANTQVSGRLFHVRRQLADFETGRRSMSMEEAQDLVRVLKEIGIQAVKNENRLLQVDFSGRKGRPEEAAAIGELYDVPDGCIDLSKVLLDYELHPADLTPDDLQTFARRLMQIGGDALALVHEISRSRWNERARQERAAREGEAAPRDVAAAEAARPGSNVALLGRERSISGGETFR